MKSIQVPDQMLEIASLWIGNNRRHSYNATIKQNIAVSSFRQIKTVLMYFAWIGNGVNEQDKVMRYYWAGWFLSEKFAVLGSNTQDKAQEAAKETLHLHWVYCANKSYNSHICTPGAKISLGTRARSKIHRRDI